jgi:hypothetical protein
MSIFSRRHSIKFKSADPLDDGTAEAIDAEKREAGITLSDEDNQSLTDFWEGVSKNLKKDPGWFDFDDE